MSLDLDNFDLPLIRCPMCGTTRIGPYDQDFRGCFIYRCQSCHVKFMNPQYTDDYLERYYSTYVDEFQVEHGPQQRQRREISKESDIRWVGEFVSPGRFLAIGCGDGMELNIARRLGWEVEGYDVDQQTTQRVAHEVGAPVHSGDFFSLELNSDAYDCVFMDQVLEHPKNPQGYLREVHRLLKPGGVLLIGCPNIMSVSSVLKTALGKWGLKRRRGRHYDTFHHLFYYSPWVLRRVLEKHFDYRVLAFEGAPLGGVKRKLEGDGPLVRLSLSLRRKLPALEGTFRLLAQKPANGAQSPVSQRRAAA